MTLRKRSVYENTVGVDAAIEIIKANPERKWLVFTRSIKDADKVGESVGRAYHSKMSKKYNKETLELFEAGIINVVATVDALNEGADIKGADAAIAVSGVSNSLVGIQTLGRIIRKEGDKHAIFINLYSDSETDKRWVTSRTRHFNPIWLENTTEIKKWL